MAHQSWSEFKAEADANREAKRQEREAKRQQGNANRDAKQQERDNRRQERDAKRRDKAEAKAAKTAAKDAKAREKAAARGIANSQRHLVSSSIKMAGFNVGVTIDRDAATFHHFGSMAQPIAGSIAELIDGDVSQRLSVARLALVGPLALGMPKKTGHRNIIFTTSTGQQISVKVRPENTQKAIKFCTQFNSLSSTLSTQN